MSMPRRMVEACSAGKLVRDRPARRARDIAEPLLQREIVDLVDDAVDVVGRASALGLDGAVMLEEFLRRLAAPHQLVGTEAVAASASTMPICVSAGISLTSPQA
jgi:hypothetical protein